MMLGAPLVSHGMPTIGLGKPGYGTPSSIDRFPSPAHFTLKAIDGFPNAIDGFQCAIDGFRIVIRLTVHPIDRLRVPGYRPRNPIDRFPGPRRGTPSLAGGTPGSIDGARQAISARESDLADLRHGISALEKTSVACQHRLPSLTWNLPMAVVRDRPYAGMNFLVDLGTGEDGAQGGVAEVTFPDARLQLNDYRNGNDKTLEGTRLSTLTHYGHLVLRRGVTGSLAWYQWWDEARNGGDARRSISVTLLDEQGNPAMRWRFLRARPAAYQTSSMEAALAETLFETLEIAFDRFELE